MGRRTIVLVIAIALAAVSASAVWRYLTTVESDIRADIAEVRVYRATELIEAKTTGEDAQPFIEEALALRENVVFEGSTILCAGPKAENEGQDPNVYGCPENPRDLTNTLAGKVAAGPVEAAVDAGNAPDDRQGFGIGQQVVDIGGVEAGGQNGRISSDS